jgi:hypothetical protein
MAIMGHTTLVAAQIYIHYSKEITMETKGIDLF